MYGPGYTARLHSEGYELFLYAAPPLAVEFLRRNWRGGMSAESARSLLAKNGYVLPKKIDSALYGRVLGVQSNIRSRGALIWE
jgi:hypothetical protein